MSITIRDALKIGGLVNAIVLAGEAGLDKEIRTVDIIDVPDAAIWFRKDSLLSTTFYALKDNIEAQLNMLEDIKSCGGAGLIIFSPERYISHIDERLVNKANDLKLPLLQMPDCSYIDVIVPVMSQILDKQVRALEYAHEVHSMMTDIVLKGKGLKELLATLTVLIEKPVLMADNEQLLIDAASPPGSSETPPILKQWQKSGKHFPLADFYPGGLLNDLVYKKKPVYYQHGSAEADYIDFFFPVVAGEDFYGTLIVPDLSEELEKAKTVAMEAGAMAIALDILKKKAIKEAERKNELDFYNELLLGNIKNRETIISQARQFGFDPSSSYFVVLVELSKESIYYNNLAAKNPGMNREKLEKRLFRLLHYALEKEGEEGVVVEALGSMVIIVHSSIKVEEKDASDHVKKLVQNVRQTVEARMENIPLYIAAGEYCDSIDRINAGYLEAWETLDVGKKLFHPGFSLTYSEMAPYHMVKRFITSAETPGLYNKIYEPLLQYDREKGGELVCTLETYIECNFSRTKTADKMHLHRNSLNYRLQKISELLDRDLETLDTFPLLLASISRKISS